MKKVGFYIHSAPESLEEIGQLIEKLNVNNEYKLHSNLETDSTIFFKEQSSFYENIYNEVNEQIETLSKEFNSNYLNTPLLNKKFNFWVHLRFNSLATLLNFFKIKAWMIQLSIQESVSSFHLVNVDIKTQRLLKLHFENVSFHSFKKTYNKQTDKSLIYKNFFKIIWLGFKSSFKKIDSQNKNLLISRKISFSKILTRDGLKIEDKYIFNIADELEDDTYKRLLDTNLLSKKNLQNYTYDSINEQFDLNAEGLFFRLLLQPSFYFKMFKTYSFLNKTLKKENSFLSALLRNNKTGLINEFIIFSMYYNFFKKNKFKSLVLNDEMSPGSNSIVRAAKKAGIKTIGIQHGIINKNNLAYNFSDYELSIDNPFPDKLIVWGKDEKNYFSKNNKYLGDTIQAFGNVLLDRCKFLEPKKNKNFTILFATQPQPIHEQRLKSIADFVAAINIFPKEDLKVIVRLHPREINDFNVYESYFKKLELYDFDIDKGNEIFNQLNEIDVLVTSYSTIAKDAMILKKPIILMDYYNKDNTGLISKGVAFNAVTSNDLFTLLSKLKNNNLTINSKVYDKALSETFASTKFDVSRKIIDLL